MQIPYAFAACGGGYGLSCDFDERELRHPCDEQRFLAFSKDVLEKYGMSSSGYPYVYWEQDDAKSIHVGTGGRWIDRSGLMSSFAFHNIDTSAEALACTEILVGGYLKGRGIQAPFITKEGEEYTFDIRLTDKERKCVQKLLRDFGKDSFVRGVENTVRGYRMAPTFDEKGFVLDGERVDCSDQGYSAKLRSGRVAMASFHSVAFFVNYAIYDHK